MNEEWRYCYRNVVFRDGAFTVVKEFQAILWLKSCSPTTKDQTACAAEEGSRGDQGVSKTMIYKRILSSIKVVFLRLSIILQLQSYDMS